LALPDQYEFRVGAARRILICDFWHVNIYIRVEYFLGANFNAFKIFVG
jgi:hypothetical protein